MYIQFTTKCNMRCAHCCFACTSKGEDMSLEVLEAALEVIEDDYITIGGGEPTLNPNFEKMLFTCITKRVYYDLGHVWLATNGSNKDISLRLISLATKFKPEYFGVALSVDHYHDYDMVSDEVRNAFSKYSKDYPNITRRNVDNGVGLIKAGRAKTNGLGERDECACADLFIKPNGDIKLCGCKNSIALGNVLTSFDYSLYRELVDEYGECYKSIPKNKFKKAC